MTAGLLRVCNKNSCRDARAGRRKINLWSTAVQICLPVQLC